ncbi:MAG TPA: transposase [Trebonia sp.]|nr:transposase [Trebonia sp.]
MTNDSDDTAAKASIGEVSGYADGVDAQVREVLGRVLAQRRSAGTAFAYVAGLAPGVKANCRALAEAAGYESPYRMQALPGSYRWGWRELRAELPALAREWLPCDPGDLIGPGLAFDETAQLKDGDATACVAPQHAGCTGHVENCVTTVFAAYVTTSGQAWADFDVFMPGRWDKDLARRRVAGISREVDRRTRPQLAEDQLERLLKAGLPARWAAFDEVYGRSSALRGACEAAGLPYAAVIPRDFDGARRRSPGVLVESPHLVDLEFITVGYVLSRIVSACRGGSLTVAAAGGTSQATSATGLRQCGQAGWAARPACPAVPAAGGDGSATPAVAAAGPATSQVAA